MDHNAWRVIGLPLAIAIVMSLAVAPVLAQTSSSPPGVVVQKTTTVNAPGNTVVTERTLRNGQLTKEEITVTTPAGALVSKTETVFNNAGQVVKREAVTVSGNTVTKTEQKLVNGQVVKQEIETITTTNGQRVKVEREFQLVNGQLVEVKREQQVEAIKEKVREIEKVKEIEKAEKAADKDKDNGKNNDKGKGKDKDKD